MIILRNLYFLCVCLVVIPGIFYSYSYAQSKLPAEANTKNERANNIIGKSLDANDAKATSVEEIEKIIIEGTYDPENLPKKKKTIEQKLEAALNPKAPLADPPPIGYQIQCVKQCTGPFCCTWVPGPRSYLRPDTEHK